MSSKTRMMALALLSAGMLLAACNKPKQSANQANGQLSNIELESLVRAKLNNDPEIKSSDLKVFTDAGKQQVTLFGDLKSEDARKRALSLAQSAGHGISVVDQISVPPQELARTTKSKKAKNSRFTDKLTKGSTHH